MTLVGSGKPSGEESEREDGRELVYSGNLCPTHEVLLIRCSEDYSLKYC